jgi:cell division septation protein DedD
VSPERDDPTAEQEYELYEDVPPRSIFAAPWFRVVLVVIVLGVIGAVAVPYVLDWMNPPPPPRSAMTAKSPMVVTPSGDTPADKPSSEKSASEKSASDKKDSTLVPVPAPSPVTPPLTAAPPRSESSSESKSAAPTAKPATGPRPMAKAAPPEPKPPTPPAEPKSKSAMAVTDSPAKPSAAKPETTAKSEPTPATATRPSAPRQAAAKATTPAPAAGGSGPYWVQVGAFKDPETAKRVATKLRDENFKVEESLRRAGGTAPAATPPAAKAPAAATGSDQYDVFVTGMSVEELNRRLAGKGLAAETSGSGVVIKPSLPLREAVALSKDLAVEGFKVQVRRAGSAPSAAAPAPATPPAPPEGGQALHRVRVGAFADKAGALAAARELEAKGYKPYIARGDQ